MGKFLDNTTDTHPPEVLWDELTPSEKASFIRQGYPPPDGTIMTNDLYTAMEQAREKPP